MPFEKFKELSPNEQLIIPFKGLEDGWYNFVFSIKDNFFQALDYSELKKGNLSVAVRMEKNLNLSSLYFKIDGTVNVKCDLCLDYFDIQVNYSNKLYLRLTEEENSNSDEYLIVSPEDEVLDITHYVYESICLSLPYQRVHQKNDKGISTCNKDMLKRIKQYSALKSSNKGEKTDPRWEKLKKLYN